MNVDTPPEDQKIVKTLLLKVYRTLELTIITPWTVYMDTKSARLEITSSLKKLNIEYFTIEATEGAAMDVDDKDAADRQQLQELVRKQSEANTNTNSMQQELLKQLPQQIKGLQSSSAKKARGAHPASRNKNKKGGKGHTKAKSNRSKLPAPTETEINKTAKQEMPTYSDSEKNNSNHRSRENSKKKLQKKKSNGQQVIKQQQQQHQHQQ
jgi:preprotein translocase subunit SecD